MSQQALPPPNTARLAITSLCNLLRHHGITSLEPELVRQAKFDGPVAAPLWHVLHDTVLVVLSGCPGAPACQAALSRQWSQVSLELSGDEDFPREGVAFVIRQLAVWGAPPDLLRELGPLTGDPDPDLADPERSGIGSGSWPRCRSRPLLLALGWLVAAAGLFERRIGELELGPGLRALLPPYPPDACVSPAVQAAYDSAAREAQEHVQKLAPAGGGLAAGAAATAAGGRSAGSRARGGAGAGGACSSDPFGTPAAAEALWGDVEAAAQRAVMLCGRVRSRLVALQAATDCRNRLSYSLWSRQAAAAPCSRPLTPYELQLCAQPANMQRHMAALEAATLGLLEQQELAAHGALFFEWLTSVIEEEAQQHQQQQHRRQGLAGGPRGAGGGSHRNTQASRTGGGGGLTSLERLPYIGSDAGARLATHLEAQLKAAVQAAEPEVAAARRRATDSLRQGGGGGGGAHATAGSGPGARLPLPPPPPLGVTLEHFLEMAEQAVPEEQLPDPGSWNADSGGGGSGGSGGGPSSGGSGLGAALGLPLLVGGAAAATAAAAADAGAWRLPDDLSAALDAVQDAEQRRRSAEEEEEARFRQLRYAALARYDFSAAAAAAGGPPLGAAAPGAGGATSAAAETQRLLGVVLAAARPLARTRAAHKAALLGALQDLPEGYFVAGL